MLNTTVETSSVEPALRHRVAILRRWCLGLAVACIASSATATERSVTVTEKVHLGVPPARAWDAIKDFMRWPSWHPAFASTKLLAGDGRSPGSVRLLRAKDGAQFTEELTAWNAAERCLTYRILESPAPVIGYVSTLEVQGSRSGSTVVWSSSFTVKDGTSEEEAKKAIAAIYRVGLDNLATAID
jgi:hypothetical protein